MDRQTRRIYELKAEVLSAAGHPIRLAAMEYLRDGERCVCEIAQHVGAQRSNVSRHLSVLRNAGILAQRKDGLKMMYSLKTPCILTFMECIDGVLRQRAVDAAGVLEGIDA
jgi:ArsR family transcriptional regulator